MARSSLLPYAFVWSPYICMGKMLRISKDFSSIAMLLKFHVELLGAGEWMIAKMVVVHWPRWPPCLYMVKTFKNLLLQNRGCLGAESLHKSSGKGGILKLLKWWSYIDVWLFYNKVKFASICICMGPIHLYGRNVDNKFQMTSSEASGSVLLKFNLEPPWGRGMKDC